MSDEEMGAFVFGEPPPEVVEAMRAHHDQQVMVADALRHDLQRMLDEMATEHLVTLREVLHRGFNGNDAIFPYIEGQIVAVLQWKHGVCGGCGTKHDDISSLLPDPQGVESPVDNLIKEHGEPFEPVNQAEFDTMMEKYNLRLPNEGEVVMSEKEMPVICKGCNMLYQSIEDRMLRPADECHGCIQKAAWG